MAQWLCLLCRRLEFNPWVGKIPWRRKWQPVPVSLPGKPLGQRSLAGYSPWGCKESEMTDPSKNTVFPAHCLEERFSRWGKGKKGRGKGRKRGRKRTGREGRREREEVLNDSSFFFLCSLPDYQWTRLFTLTSEMCNFSLLSTSCILSLCSDFPT